MNAKIFYKHDRDVRPSSGVEWSGLFRKTDYASEQKCQTYRCGTINIKL